MIKIRFLNENTLHEVEFSRIDNNIIQLTGNIEVNKSGFKTYKDNASELGDFSNYTTIYKNIEGGFQFSNNGSKTPAQETLTFSQMKEMLVLMQSENVNLKNELETIKSQLTDTQLALCDVYKLIGG